jgi:hypothetical protein
VSQKLPRSRPARTPTLTVVVEEEVAVGAVTPSWPAPVTGAVVTYEVVFEPDGSSAAVDAAGEVTTDTEGVTIVQMDSALNGKVVQRAVGVVYIPEAGVGLELPAPLDRVIQYDPDDLALATIEADVATGGVGTKTYTATAVDLAGNSVNLTSLGGTPPTWEFPALDFGGGVVVTIAAEDEDGTIVRETVVRSRAALVPKWTEFYSIISFGTDQVFSTSGDKTCTATKLDGTTFTANLYCAERLAGTQVWQVEGTDLFVSMETGSGGSPHAASIGVVVDVSTVPRNAVLRVDVLVVQAGNVNDKLCLYLGAAKTAYPTTSGVPNTQGTIATGDTTIDYDVRLSTSGSSMGSHASAVGVGVYTTFLIYPSGETYVQSSLSGWPDLSDTTGDLYGVTGAASSAAAGSSKRTTWGANGNATMFVALEVVNAGGSTIAAGRIQYLRVRHLNLTEACDAD